MIHIGWYCKRHWISAELCVALPQFSVALCQPYHCLAHSPPSRRYPLDAWPLNKQTVTSITRMASTSRTHHVRVYIANLRVTNLLNGRLNKIVRHRRVGGRMNLVKETKWILWENQVNLVRVSANRIQWTRASTNRIPVALATKRINNNYNNLFVHFCKFVNKRSEAETFAVRPGPSE